MATKKTTYSKVKFEEKLLGEINLLLRKDFKDPRLQKVTVTRVEVNKDFSHATVYWDTYDTGTRGEAKLAVIKMKSKMRSKLAQILNVRHTPELKFIYDSQFEDELNIVQLIKQGQ